MLSDSMTKEIVQNLGKTESVLAAYLGVIRLLQIITDYIESKSMPDSHLYRIDYFQHDLQLS